MSQKKTGKSRLEKTKIYVVICGSIVLAGLSVWEAPLSRQFRRMRNYGTHMVRAGDSLSRAHNAILDSGAEDISRSVGIRAANKWHFGWYVLNDGTALQVVYETDADFMSNNCFESMHVAYVVLGEKGKGYGDKFKWMAQTQTQLEEIQLP